MNWKEGPQDGFLSCITAKPLSSASADPSTSRKCSHEETKMDMLLDSLDTLLGLPWEHVGILNRGGDRS